MEPYKTGRAGIDASCGIEGEDGFFLAKDGMMDDPRCAKGAVGAARGRDGRDGHASSGFFSPEWWL